MSNIKLIEGSITAPRGFSAAGVFCDIKRLGTGKGSNKGQKRDLALIVSDVPAAAAGMFTTNQVCAAPVKLCAERIQNQTAQAIVVNSGNANACTGATGMKDAREMTRIAASCLNLAEEKVLAASTGRIGLALPMGHVTKGIREAATLLGKSPDHAKHAAEAIMTSDTRPKEIAVQIQIGRTAVRIGGICKGAGMIQPGMSPTGARPASAPKHATMLAFLTTDAAISGPALQEALKEAVARSFNRITVDGDMSTNDTVLILSNGLADNVFLNRPRLKNFEAFQEGLNQVTLSLAKMIVADGEGVSRLVTVSVEGARTPSDAEAAARAVANSALVKTSWFGGDPNWGRILCALGYSSAALVENKVDVGYTISGAGKITYALKAGQPTATAFETLLKLVAGKEFHLHINLNLGKGKATVYTCDLTEEYVEFNKGDVSNPAALGG